MHRLLLALLVCACNRETPTVAAAPAGVPVVTLARSGCLHAGPPAHRLAISADGLRLDDAPLQADDVVAAIAEFEELALIVHSDVSYETVRGALLKLDMARNYSLRLWIGVRVGDDPRIHHLRIGTPMLGPLAHETPPHDARVLRLDGATDRHIVVPQDSDLLVSATDTTPWRTVARGLAQGCGATLVESTALPTILATDCSLEQVPAHRLDVTTDRLVLDGVPVSDPIPALLVLARTGPRGRELSLAIDPYLAFAAVRPLLASLRGVPGLRLWIALRVGQDPQERHLPIATPQLGAPRALDELPPNSYTLSLWNEHVSFNEADPLALPRASGVGVDQLLVSATDSTAWLYVARGLAHVCEGAELIEAPIGRPTVVPERHRVPTVRQATATVTGTLDKDIVRRIVRAHINEVRGCYILALDRNAETRGRVAIAFTIDGKGKVRAPSVEDDTILDSDLATCIVDAVRRWTFPKPEGGRDVTVSYPFVLYPG